MFAVVELQMSLWEDFKRENHMGRQCIPNWRESVYYIRWRKKMKQATRKTNNLTRTGREERERIRRKEWSSEKQRNSRKVQKKISQVRKLLASAAKRWRRISARFVGVNSRMCVYIKAWPFETQWGESSISSASEALYRTFPGLYAAPSVKRLKDHESER